MTQEVKIECTVCKAHYLVEEGDIAKIKCQKCGNKTFARLDAPTPPAAASPGPREPSASQPPAARPPPASDAEAVSRMRQLHDDIIKELQKVIIGQKSVIEELVVALLCGGHCLLEGVPGLAKTLLISSLARAMSLSFKRIQFTPDLMPSDITGTEVLQDDAVTRERKFKFLPGPVFANIILADEINRTPPKTQAALLEAMQEKQVSVGGVIHKLDVPFFVLATQNPLEQEGTYPLPEAQQDRFLFKIFVDYPSKEEEVGIVRRVTEQSFGDIARVCSAAELLRMQDTMKIIPVADAVIDYANRLVRATRARREGALELVNNLLSWGGGPRATIGLITAAKCFAALDGRPTPSCDDVARAAKPVMRHRIALNYVGKAEGHTTDSVIQKVVEAVAKY